MGTPRPRRQRHHQRPTRIISKERRRRYCGQPHTHTNRNHMDSNPPAHVLVPRTIRHHHRRTRRPSHIHNARRQPRTVRTPHLRPLRLARRTRNPSQRTHPRLLVPHQNKRANRHPKKGCRSGSQIPQISTVLTTKNRAGQSSGHALGQNSGTDCGTLWDRTRNPYKQRRDRLRDTAGHY